MPVFLKYFLRLLITTAIIILIASVYFLFSKGREAFGESTIDTYWRMAFVGLFASAAGATFMTLVGRLKTGGRG
jgi:hypothetical protein